MSQTPPAYVSILENNDIELADYLKTGREFIMTDGALSAKVKTLMTMVCDSILAHEDGVKVIANRARDMGATEAEIAETVRVAFMFGGLPALVTACNAFKK